MDHEIKVDEAQRQMLIRTLSELVEHESGESATEMYEVLQKVTNTRKYHLVFLKDLVFIKSLRRNTRIALKANNSENWLDGNNVVDLEGKSISTFRIRKCSRRLPRTLIEYLVNKFVDGEIRE